MFEKVNIQDLKFNPFDEISNHWVLISAKKDGVVNTMTREGERQGKDDHLVPDRSVEHVDLLVLAAHIRPWSFGLLEPCVGA